MANNCLVTKLKSTVNNNMLDKIGDLSLYVNPSGVCNTFEISADYTLVYPDGTEELVTAGSNIASKFIANGSVQKYFLKGAKYNAVRIDCGFPNDGTIYNDLVYVKAEDLQYTEAGMLTGGSYPIVGNIGDIFKYTQPTDVTFPFGFKKFQVYGNDEDFRSFVSKVPNITSIYRVLLPSFSFYVNFSTLAEETNCLITDMSGYGYKGDIYSFVAKARISRSTGDLYMQDALQANNEATIGTESVASLMNPELGTIYLKVSWTANTITLSQFDGSSFVVLKTYNM